MSSLYTVSFPALRDADRDFIRRFRAAHDTKKSAVIDAHFTFVFGCETADGGENLTKLKYTNHVAAVASAFTKIQFCCRRATVDRDLESGAHLVFLVPDEGAAEMIQLHDELYTGPLASFLRKDLTYTPHMTVAAAAERKQAEDLCLEIYSRKLEITGTLETLTIGAVENGKFNTYSVKRLGRET